MTCPCKFFKAQIPLPHKFRRSSFLRRKMTEEGPDDDGGDAAMTMTMTIETTKEEEAPEVLPEEETALEAPPPPPPQGGVKRGATEEVSSESPQKRQRCEEVFRIAGYEFVDRRSLWNHVVEIMQRLDGSEDGIAREKDSFFLFALLEMHPTAHDKMAGGVRAVGYGLNENFPDTKSFFVAKDDGEKEGFSARKCVELVFPSDDSSQPLFLHPNAARRYRNLQQDSSATPAQVSSMASSLSPKKKDEKIERGSVVRVEGLEGQAVTISDLKDAFGRATLRWIDLDSDEGVALLRFDSAASATKALAVTDVAGCDAKGNLRILDPTEEDQVKDRLKHQQQRPPQNHRPQSRYAPSGGGGGPRNSGGRGIYGPSSSSGGRLGRALTTSKVLGGGRGIGGRGGGGGRVARPINRGGRAGRSLLP
mmetsp:Transcript_30798/g.99279  ORF Transcript_30798/g.99279 Transcript_30798/m.99279 type:complete len:421 (-) Transcript_30798:91-1353(-)